MYEQGHRFENTIADYLSELIQPDTICEGFVYKDNTGRHLEIDIIFVKDSKIICVECKDYKGELLQHPTRIDKILYNGNVMHSFVETQRMKSKRLNKLISTEAVGMCVIGKKCTIVGVPSTISERDLHKLPTIIKHVKPSSQDSVVGLMKLMAPGRQHVLRREGGYLK